MQSNTRYLCLLCFILFSQMPAWAQYGVLDPSFGNQGIVFEPAIDALGTHALSGLEITPDGKIMQVSLLGGLSGTNALLTRRNSDGSLDPTFGQMGKVQIGDSLLSDFLEVTMAVQPDGKTLLGISGLMDVNVAFPPFAFLLRIDQNGRIDSSFGMNGVVDAFLDSTYTYIRDIDVQADGKILVAKWTQQMCRLSADGILDTGFGVNGWTSRYGNRSGKEFILESADGSLFLVTGGVLPIGAFDQGFILVRKFSSSGQHDIHYGSFIPMQGYGQYYYEEDYGTDLRVLGAALRPDASMYILISRGDTMEGVLRLTPNGEPDMAFGNSGKFARQGDLGLTVQPDDKLILISANQDSVFVHRFQTNSTQLDSTFGVAGVFGNAFQGPRNASRMQIDDQGRLLVSTSMSYLFRLSTGLQIVGEMEPSSGAMFLQAYPNPSNGTLHLSVALAKASLIRCTLYDLQGQLVQEFEAEAMAAGRHEISLGIMDGLPIGTYILRVQAGNGLVKSLLLKRV